MHPDHNYPSARLTVFLRRLDELVDAKADAPMLLDTAAALLRELIAVDDWLPPEQAMPDPARYRQNLLHRDAAGRFSVVAFVWGPGQETPIHDHTVWGLIGMLRGAETSQAYRFTGPTTLVEDGPATLIRAGQVATVGPHVGDIHRVRNAFDDRVSISVHVYGGDIGALARSVYREDGTRRPFVSGYSAPWQLAPHPESILS
jgi:predicted metal-dependent enzyme (double-stranded beta helix superfamily)